MPITTLYSSTYYIWNFFFHKSTYIIILPFLNNRKSFRPAYGKLDLLTSIFSKTPIIGLTATATKQMQQKIVEAMGMISPFVIDVNPDCKNIYFSSSRRGNQGDEKLVNILDPLLKDLRSRRQDFPLTIIYGNLETIANCFSYFSSELGNEQYEPIDAPKLAETGYSLNIMPSILNMNERELLMN